MAKGSRPQTPGGAPFHSVTVRAMAWEKNPDRGILVSRGDTTPGPVSYLGAGGTRPPRRELSVLTWCLQEYVQDSRQHEDRCKGK